MPGSVPWILLLTAALFFVVPSTGTAATSLSLPSSHPFSILVDLVAESAAEPHWQCAPAAESRCDCVDFYGEDAQLALSNLASTAEGLQADKLHLSWQNGHLTATDVRIELKASATTVSFHESDWMLGGAEEILLSTGPGKLVREGDNWEAVFEQPQWQSKVAFPDAGASCDAAVWEVDNSRGIDRGSAARAMLVDGQWTVEEFRLGGRLPSPPQRSSLTSRPQPGFLPPAVRIYPDGGRLSAAYWFGETPLTVESHVESTGAAGLGVGVWSASPFCGTEPCPRRSLNLDAFADADGVAALVVGGEGALGTPGRHVSASLDGIEWNHADFRPGAATRLERSALFRDWSMQRAGISLSGEHHDLMMDATAVSDDVQGWALGDDSLWAAEVWTRYGTQLRLGRAGRADLRLQHGEFGGDEAARVRTSRTVLRLDRLVGSTGRVFLRPTVRGDMTLGVSDAAEGATAGTRTRLETHLEGGMALRGTPGGRTHILSPRGVVGRHIQLADALPDAIGAVGAVHSGGPTTYNFVGTQLDQHLIGDEHRLRFPAAVVFVDDGAGQHWQMISDVTVEYTPVGGRTVVVGADGQCVGRCERGGVRGRLHLTWTEQVETVQVVGWGMNHRVDGPSWIRRVRSGDGHRWNGVHPGDGSSIVHASSIRARWNHWRGQLGVVGDLQSPSQLGAEMIAEHHWSEVGWGIGLRMAALPAQSRWAATLGISSSPVF